MKNFGLVKTFILGSMFLTTASSAWAIDPQDPFSSCMLTVERIDEDLKIETEMVELRPSAGQSANGNVYYEAKIGNISAFIIHNRGNPIVDEKITGPAKEHFPIWVRPSEPELAYLILGIDQIRSGTTSAFLRSKVDSKRIFDLNEIMMNLIEKQTGSIFIEQHSAELTSNIIDRSISNTVVTSISCQALI